MKSITWHVHFFLFIIIIIIIIISFLTSFSHQR